MREIQNQFSGDCSRVGEMLSCIWPRSLAMSQLTSGPATVIEALIAFAPLVFELVM